MNVLNQVTWQAMTANRTRTIVTVIGVILSAAMFSAVTIAAFNARDFLIRGYVYEEGDYFVNYDYATDSQAEALAQEEAVTQLADYKCLGYTVFEDSDRFLGTYLVGAVDETFFQTMPVRLTEGRLPENSSELLLPKSYASTAENLGQPCAVGDTVTVSMRSKLDEPYDDIAFFDSIEDQRWEASYTVVGLYEDHSFRTSDYGCNSLLTVSDGGEPAALWHRLYAKTSAADAKAVIQWGVNEFGARKFLHNDLLHMYGATRYTNINSMIVYLAVILMAIIMVSSVSLIHNAFSISISERTKQFGLLSSVGATKKQLRQSVLFEARVISVIGIPIGLLCGYGGIAVVFSLLGKYLESLFSFSVNHQVRLYAAPSWPAFLAAAVVCAVTVLLSAWMPARRINQITPLEAIRQSGDIKAGARDVKVGRLTYRLFGLPGVLAKKYFGVSRRKYRSTVISLAFSLVLFVVAGYFSQQLTSSYSSSTQLENFDFDCTALAEDPSENAAILQQATSSPGVERSALVSIESFYCVLPTDCLDEQYKAINIWQQDYSGDYCCEWVNVVYLEDDVLAEHLRAQGIDPSRYIGVEHPSALLCMQNISQTVINEDGTYTRNAYHLRPVSQEAGPLTLYAPGNLPEALYKDLADFSMDVTASDSGALLWVFSVPDEDGGVVYHYYDMVFSPDESGAYMVDYYNYDLETGSTGALVATSTPRTDPMEVTIGDVLEELPFGVRRSANDYITLVYPLSARRTDYQEPTYLRLKVSNYTTALEHLQAIDNLNLIDEVEDVLNARGLLLTVQVCSAGFIILISLICVANVFNTISTNIALRRRDFGMLKSVGMQSRELYRMMSFECVIYGFRAFLWGFPVSLVLCFGLYRVFLLSYDFSFAVPWLLLLIGTLCIIAVVFVSMLYAVSKLKQDNPMDAIRMENL